MWHILGRGPSSVSSPEKAHRVMNRVKTSPTLVRCPRSFSFFKNLFHQKQCKYAMNIGQLKCPLIDFLGKILAETLPSVSKITPVNTGHYRWDLVGIYSHTNLIQNILSWTQDVNWTCIKRSDVCVHEGGMGKRPQINLLNFMWCITYSTQFMALLFLHPLKTSKTQGA